MHPRRRRERSAVRGLTTIRRGTRSHVRRLVSLALVLVPFVFVLLSSCTSRAQARETQLWTGAFLVGKDPRTATKDQGLSLWVDMQTRRGEEGTTWIARPALGYRLSPRWSVWAGYAWVGTFVDADDRPDVIEQRAWQQGLYTDKIGQLTYQLRPRLEERFRHGEDAALRARMLARANVAFWPDGPLALAAWDEVFVAFAKTSWGAPGGFDQNRLFLGLGYTQGIMRIEIGYIGTTVRRADDSLLHQHNPSLFGFFTF